MYTTLSNSTTTSVSSSPHSPSLKSKKSHDNRELISLCLQYLRTNNHGGLALLARQRGIPPMLRHRVWPILLKYHPYVVNPYISADVHNDEDGELPPDGKIKRELLKYFRIRNESNNTSGGSSPSDHQGVSPIEDEMMRIMEAAIMKFFSKWGGITKFDSGFVWIALGLAEWFPPIPNSNYVLCGRDSLNKSNHLTQLTEFTEDNSDPEDSFQLDHQSMSTSDEIPQQMTFAEVFERLCLVLLHSREEPHDDNELTKTRTITDLISSNSLNQQELLFKSGGIETRIQFFLVAFAKLLPELYKSLSEDDMLNNNSNKNNQWLTWWFKYCGAKVFNKFDRGRIWDSLMGFRYRYDQYLEEYADHVKMLKKYKKLYDVTLEGFESDPFWYKPMDSDLLKWSQIDYQLQLVFIYVSILQRNESKLLEFDQFEINEFLTKLPMTNKASVESLQNSSEYYTDFEKVLRDAGELWRNWLWNEIRDENHDQ